ncbi:MAG: cobyrinate a,c-diamide synthase [Rickettsiales bacterium]
MVKTLMVAAPRSGSGKTTVTLGLLRALARRGIKISSFKCGPDYIDPAFHKVATGRSCYNLDSWTMPEHVLAANFRRGIGGAEFVIAEGSMGLFDGVAMDGASGNGASSDIAARFNMPVLLVVDASGHSQSAGAVALGFNNFNPDIKIAGVVLGNIASERHYNLAKIGVEKAGIKVFGFLPRGSVPPIPERHLGLVQAGEIANIEKMIDAVADSIEKHLDIDSISAMACHPALVAGSRNKTTDLICNFIPRDKCGAAVRRIALASDIVFSFMYEHVLAGWRESGIEIIPFSPLADEPPDMDADLCWLAGGYPELHANTLSSNKNFLHGLQEFATEKPVHGECGGYMVLGEAIIDAGGAEHKMAGLLPLVTSFSSKKLHLGYRKVTLATDCPIGLKESIVRGHEFHYATVIKQGEAESIGDIEDANGYALGSAGMKSGNVSGTFFHMVAGEE